MELDRGDMLATYKNAVKKLNIEKDYYMLSRQDLFVCAMALEKLLECQMQRISNLQEDNYERD